MQISINLKPDLVQKVDEAKGIQSRSSFIVTCIDEHINPPITHAEEHINQLTTQLEAIKSTVSSLEQRLTDKQNEVDYLRQEYTKINDALAQRFLTEAKPKKSWWDRIRGR